MPQHTRPVLWAAIKLEPEPRKGSSRISPRWVRSVKASSSKSVAPSIQPRRRSGPQIGAIASALAKRNVVDVGGS